MLSVGVNGKEEIAAVGAITPISFPGALAAYPLFGISLDVNPQQTLLYPVKRFGLSTQYA